VPFDVHLEHAGMRVDAFLAARLHRYSRMEVRRLVSEGRVLLRGRAVKPAARVAQGETVLVRYPRRREEPARYASLPVIHRDAELLAVAKPADLICHPTDRVVANTVVSVLAAQFPGERLHLVHRLDRETSGTLLLARSREAARALVEAFTRGEVRKEYLALCAGRFPLPRLRVELPLGREGGDIKVRQTVRLDAADGLELGDDEPIQEAVTEFERLETDGRASLVLARPKTGRLHQIRVHLAALGCPVLGDKLYTGEGEGYLKAVRKELVAEDLRALGAPRQMLHAFRLRLRHPAGGKELTLSAPLPDDFRACADSLGLRIPKGDSQGE
jgi:RluA family pseudouridine synthase